MVWHVQVVEFIIIDPGNPKKYLNVRITFSRAGNVKTMLENPGNLYNNKTISFLE